MTDDYEDGKTLFCHSQLTLLTILLLLTVMSKGKGKLFHTRAGEKITTLEEKRTLLINIEGHSLQARMTSSPK